MEPFGRSRTQKQYSQPQIKQPRSISAPEVTVKSKLNANAFEFRPSGRFTSISDDPKPTPKSKSKPNDPDPDVAPGTISPLPPSRHTVVKRRTTSISPSDLAKLSRRTAASTRSVAHRRIGKFMKTHRSKITATYLSHLCTDANECMAFGHGEYQRIRSFFDFTSFKYAPELVHLLRSSSSQGQVGIIRYAREKYNAAAILKLAKTTFADSPYYEFTVGRFVNEYLTDAYPCFTETYGLLALAKDTHKQLKQGTHGVNFSKSKPPLFVDSDIPLARLTSDADLIRSACAAGTSLGLIAQYFDNTWSLKELSYQDPQFCANDAFALLFQVYGPMASIYDHFTHYDLHGGNVLLVPAPSGTCIQMHYHLPGGNTITFKTKYIAKIIDYGRCFFRATEESQSSARLSKVLCGANLCPGKCGSRSGFLLDPKNPNAPVQVTPIKRNQSIDLLCAYEFLKRIHSYDSTGMLTALFAQLPPIFGPTPYQITDSYSEKSGAKQINTVTVLAAVLWDKMGAPEYALANEHMHASRTVYGHLHVDLTNRPGVPVKPVRWV